MADTDTTPTPARVRRVVELTLRDPTGRLERLAIETDVGGRIGPEQRHWIEQALAVVLQEYRFELAHRREVFRPEPGGDAGVN